MPEYYLDIETEGIDPSKHKILTIQFQKLRTVDGEPLSDLSILKEWELSEKELIRKFLNESSWHIGKRWNFIPVGTNLNFDLIFLRERIKELLGIDIPLKWLFFDLPRVDIFHTLVMMNQGEFRGAGLDKFTEKKTDGSVIPEFYRKKEFDSILEYIIDENKSFIRFYQFIKKRMPGLTLDWANHIRSL